MNREKQLKKWREYSKHYYAKNREELRPKMNAYNVEYQKRLGNNEKRKARSALNRMIRSGKIQREPCIKCGERGEAHHEDYSKPYDVLWLCKLHHEALHK